MTIRFYEDDYVHETLTPERLVVLERHYEWLRSMLQEPVLPDVDLDPDEEGEN